MTPRETIFSTLFSTLTTALGATIVTSSRRWKHWDDVPASACPALYLTQGKQRAEFVQKIPTRWWLDADIYLYAKTGGDMKAAPSTVLNPIVDAIVTALQPSGVTGEQTLGGLVTSCRIEGEIATDEGVLGDTALVVIPVRIFTPQ